MAGYSSTRAGDLARWRQVEAPGARRHAGHQHRVARTAGLQHRLARSRRASRRAHGSRWRASMLGATLGLHLRPRPTACARRRGGPGRAGIAHVLPQSVSPTLGLQRSRRPERHVETSRRYYEPVTSPARVGGPGAPGPGSAPTRWTPLERGGGRPGSSTISTRSPTRACCSGCSRSAAANRWIERSPTISASDSAGTASTGRASRATVHRRFRNPGDWNWANVQSAGGGCPVVGDRLYFYVSGRRGCRARGCRENARPDWRRCGAMDSPR